MDRFRSAKDNLNVALHKKNPFTDILQQVENKTKVSRVNIVLGMVVVLLIYMVFGYGTSFLATFIGFVYPAYRSIKALESHEKEDDTKWLTYWVVFAAVSVLEAFTDFFFYWIPLYSLMKCGMFVFMMIPMSPNGSMLIYEHIIRPYALKHQKKIDQALDQANDMVADFSKTAKKKAVDLVADQIKED